MKKKSQERGYFCPLLNKRCIGDACKFWVMLLGKNPQTQKEVPEYDCSLKWLPFLLVETTRAVNGTQAATESFRNEMIETGQKILINSHVENRKNLKPQIIDTKPKKKFLGLF